MYLTMYFSYPTSRYERFFIKQLNLIKKILSISNSQKRNFLNECKDCCDEIVTLPKTHHVTIDQNITSVVTTVRKISIALVNKLK